MIVLVRTFDLGVWLEVGGSSGYALPPACVRNWYIYPGITLCVVSPTLASLVRVWFSPVASVVSSDGFPIRRDYDTG